MIQYMYTKFRKAPFNKPSKIKLSCNETFICPKIKQGILVPDNKDGIFKQKHKLLPFCNWEKHVPNSFSMNGDIFYCNSVDELIRALGHEHKPEVW
jgi:hypothetical protein